MSTSDGVHETPDQVTLSRWERHLPRTDLQAIVQGGFMAEVYGLPQVIAELDRINGLIDDLSAREHGEISDDMIKAVRDPNIDKLAAELKLTWPWFVPQLRSGLWWRRQLVEAERWRAAQAGEEPAAHVPGWPLETIGDRRVLAAGGGPWALVHMELAPRFAMKSGDSREALELRWQKISESVEAAFRMSWFSYLIDKGPPGGASKDDAAAYERYARWAARKLVGGESFRRIAETEFKADASTGKDSDTGSSTAPRERWREVKRAIRKALDILDSI